jgi:hypothetical protein
MGQNGPKWTKKWAKMGRKMPSQNGPKWAKMGQNGPKWTKKMGQNGSENAVSTVFHKRVVVQQGAATKPATTVRFESPRNSW